MTVKIVTDSTSDFPKDTAQSLGVTVVAQNVHFGTETFKDNVTITPEEFYSMLARGTELPKTSQASPGEFKEVYDELGTDADGIVSVHVSSKISGTCNSALQAAELTSASCPVEVVDSAQASMGLGLAAAAASPRPPTGEPATTRSRRRRETPLPGPGASVCSRRWSTWRRAVGSAKPRR